jgi:hypothetical protein
MAGSALVLRLRPVDWQTPSQPPSANRIGIKSVHEAIFELLPCLSSAAPQAGKLTMMLERGVNGLLVVRIPCVAQ